jgi:hypothetical protein
VPDESFSFASLVKPGEGAKRALANHLSARAAKERETKPPHWRYGGTADFLQQHGEFFTGRELPEEWERLRGPENQCHDNALAAAVMEPSLRYFTGLYIIGHTPSQHSWCVDANGELLEFTLPNAAERGRAPVIAAGTRRAMDGTTTPMLTPPHWAYVGVEYTTEFASRHAEERGMPILDPHFLMFNFDHDHGCYLHSEDPPMWLVPYDKAGFTVPPAPDLCGQCDGWGTAFNDADNDADDKCLNCGGTGAEP